MLGWEGTFEPGELITPDFREGPDAILSISAVDLLNAKRRTDRRFRDRVVFVGYSASGVGDQYFVPVGARNRPQPGVLVQAAVTSSIVRGGLLTRVQPWLALLFTLTIALAVQRLRSLSGRLHPRYLVVIVMGIVAGSLLALWFAETVVPTVTLLLAVVLSVAIREISESRLAQKEAGEILQSLLAESSSEVGYRIPQGVQGRLEIVRSLQESLARDRNLRRTLLEGLTEGVILWGEDGLPLMANSALSERWGHQPSAQEIEAAIEQE